MYESLSISDSTSVTELPSEQINIAREIPVKHNTSYATSFKNLTNNEIVLQHVSQINFFQREELIFSHKQ